MAFFELNSDIQIGDFHFSGVSDLLISRSVHSYSDSAVLTIPAICKVRSGNQVSDYQASADLISDRDPVRISLGYNGSLRQEFRGFVRRRSLSMPLQVECEGLSQVMRLDMDVSASLEVTSSTQLASYLRKGFKGAGIPINVVVADDLPLQNLLLTHVNGTEICDAVKRFSQETMSIFFKDFSTLWMGLLYTPLRHGNDPLSSGKVLYRPGYNCLRDGGLREHTASDPVQIVFHNFSATGVRTQVLSEADEKGRARQEVSIMNNIGDAATLLRLANEKMYQFNYKGYSGYLTGFLEPYCAPGWLAEVRDDLYPERNGAYLVESTEVRFGKGGARRKVELGPALGFSV